MAKIIYNLNKSEDEKLSEWLKEHDKNCPYAPPNNSGAIGGSLTYSFTPTSIGIVKKITCACKEVCDYTDYDCW